MEKSKNSKMPISIRYGKSIKIAKYLYLYKNTNCGLITSLCTYIWMEKTVWWITQAWSSDCNSKISSLSNETEKKGFSLVIALNLLWPGSCSNSKIPNGINCKHTDNEHSLYSLNLF